MDGYHQRDEGMMLDWLWQRPRRVARAGGEHALYTQQDRANTKALTQFQTPARGYREHVVNLSVDEIEDLILAESAKREPGPPDA
jgi:hypothetical protein